LGKGFQSVRKAVWRHRGERFNGGKGTRVSRKKNTHRRNATASKSLPPRKEKKRKVNSPKPGSRSDVLVTFFGQWGGRKPLERKKMKELRKSTAQERDRGSLRRPFAAGKRGSGEKKANAKRGRQEEMRSVDLK